MEKKEQTSMQIPSSRFDEFSEAWQRKRAGDAFSIFNGYAFSSNNAQVKGCRWIKIADVGILRMKSNNKAFLPKEFATKYAKFLLKEGDYVVALTRPILNGKLKIAQIDKEHSNSLLNQRVGKLVTENAPAFIYFVLQRRNLAFQIDARIAGTDPPNLAPSEISSLPIFIPSLPEQQKIADFLTAVDGRIQQLIQKKALLEDYKKGVMQQLFSQTIRFKDADGNYFPDWEERKLGEVGRVIRGSSPRPKGDSRYYGGPVPRLMVQDVTRDGKWVTPCIDSLTEAGAKLSRPCPAGTLTIVCSGTVGVVSFLAVDACIHDGFLALIEIDENTVTKDFLFQRLNTLREQFEKGATHGGVFTNLTTSEIKEFEFDCPSIEEQTKIADFLSSIDRKIESVTTQITETQTFKRGLLQQMFV